MDNVGWTTKNELAYINGLAYGGFSMLKYHRCLLTPAELLENYVRSAKRRKAWGTFGSVDPDEVIDYANHLLGRKEG